MINNNSIVLYKSKSIKNIYNHCYKTYFFHIRKTYTRSLYSKTPIIYNDSLSNKFNILNENKGKSGIYRWILSSNNESYVGSSTNISKRLRRYYSINYLKDKTLKYNSRIYIALLKYGYKNFNLEILEYCNKEYLIAREQYYLDLLKPEYNICKTAGSMLGFKHSRETLLKLKNRDSATGYTTIIINKVNNKKKIYNSLRAAGKSICVSHTTLRRYINKNKLLNNLYFIKSKDYL